MFAHLLLIGLSVAGQVSSPNDRYSQGNQVSPPPRAGSGAVNTAPIVPLDTTPANAAPPPLNTPNGNAVDADPYKKKAGAPASGAGQIAPLNGAAQPAARSPFGGTTQGAPPATTAPANPSVAGVMPSAMIRDMLAAPRGSQIVGEYVPLVDVLARATSRVEQSQRVEAYWDLCSSVADYYLALREQDELRRLRTLVPRVGPTWDQAEAELAVRLGTSQRAAMAAQLRVANYLNRGTKRLPLPADMPHCGSYRSRYEENFAGRQIVEAQELAQLLPLRYAELKDAANAATRAEEFVQSVARKDADGAGTLRAMELLALRRRAFVQIARDYNRRIARYTELATPGEVGADRLVGMLIKQENPSTATRPSSPAAPSGRQSRSEGPPPQTFVDGEGWEPASNGTIRDESVQRTSAETRRPLRQERSLLVRPRN